MTPSKLRELSQWDEDYVASLPVGELDWIEYKASAKLADADWTSNMSKYASAWANYDSQRRRWGLADAPLISLRNRADLFLGTVGGIILIRRRRL